MDDVYFTVRYGVTGAFMVIHERDYLQSAILSTGVYEPEIWEKISQHTQRGDIFWDIGANIGAFSVMASVDPRFSEIHAFEPQVRILAQLHRNILLNDNSKTKIYEFALSDHNGECKLFISPATNTGATSLRYQTEVNQRSALVKCFMIDELIAEDIAPNPTIMKIDVEGWELEILRGGQKLLSGSPPRLIVFECGIDVHTRLPESLEILSLLTNYGYTVEHIPRRDGSFFESTENFAAILNPQADNSFIDN